MKALILGGATGLLGQALNLALQAAKIETVTLGRENGNLLDKTFLEDQLVNLNADLIFNTVAYTQVDQAEDDQAEAYKINQSLAENLAHIIAKLKHGLLLHYSTDFVFDYEQIHGQRQEPFRENDATNALCVYGKSKLASEQALLQILGKRCAILRTAWLFGPHRKNFVTTILNAAKTRSELKVVNDQIGSPSYTIDVAKWSVLLAQKWLAKPDSTGLDLAGIWHTVNSGQASWYDLAKTAVSLAKLDCKVLPITSAEWPQKAKRPAYSVLNNQKLASTLEISLRSWQDALADYLNKEASNA